MTFSDRGWTVKGQFKSSENMRVEPSSVRKKSRPGNVHCMAPLLDIKHLGGIILLSFGSYGPESWTWSLGWLTARVSAGN